MVNDIRLLRLSEVVKQKASKVILYELKDPRLGFVTVTGVKLARDLTQCVVLWSIVGTAGERSKTAHALEDARGVVQSAIAKEMGTRKTPRITFRYDPSAERAQKVHGLLAQLRQERLERGEPDVPAVPGSEEE
jgi:ribosome-binding factor A